MIRSTSWFLCFALAAAPAAASNYSANLAAPTASQFITRDIVWNCTAAACQGSTAESRPVVLCESLAKRVGKIECFAADGRSFTTAELDRCNASAKAAARQPLAGN